MDKIKILVACHKPGSVRHDDVYTPIHVGRAISKYKEEMSDMIGDDTGDNISEKNPFYSEMTAQYWAWKNLHDVEYIGFCHYRRYFNLKISQENIDSLFKNNDVILLGYHCTDVIMRGVSTTLSVEDVTIFLEVLRRMHPEYEKTTLDYLWNIRFHKCNMLICRKELFDHYASWMFGILFECEKYIRLSPYSRGKRVFAYLAEYFMPIYFLHNHSRIRTAKYVDYVGAPINITKEKIKDFAKSALFYINKPFIIKPKSFVASYDHAVITGLKNDGIIPIGE